MKRYFLILTGLLLAAYCSAQNLSAMYAQYRFPLQISHNKRYFTDADRKLLVSYLPQIQPVVVDFGILSGEAFRIKWFDPASGRSVKEFTIESRKLQKLQTPSGEDFVLVIESL